MLFELLPHLARLMPVADKFLNSRNATGEAQEAALATFAEGVRGDLGQVSETNAGIQRALKEQGEQVSEIAVEVTRARMGVESVEARVARLEIAAGRAMKVLVVIVMMVAVALWLLVYLLLRQAR